MDLRRVDGEKNPGSRLTDAERDEIVRLWEDGVSRREIAERYGITPSHASHIARRWPLMKEARK